MNTSVIKFFVITAFLLAATNLQADNGKPDLWKTEKNGVISYLFGSIHLGSPDMYPLSKAVNQAYLSSENLVVEVDLKPGDELKMLPLIQKHGLNLTVPIEKRLSKKTLAIYQSACQKKSLSCEQFAPLKTWLASLQLSVMAMKRLGYDENSGIDKYFLDKAHQSNKNVIPLETADAQIKMLANFNQEQQELMLIQSLQATEQDYSNLVAAWKSGDDKVIVSMFHKDLDKPGAKAMYKIMLDDRNINMVAKISQYVAAKKSLFVVVGQGHIAGDKGLVALLKKEGFKVTQVE